MDMGSKCWAPIVIYNYCDTALFGKMVTCKAFLDGWINWNIFLRGFVFVYVSLRKIILTIKVVIGTIKISRFHIMFSDLLKYGRRGEIGFKLDVILCFGRGEIVNMRDLDHFNTNLCPQFWCLLFDNMWFRISWIEFSIIDFLTSEWWSVNWIKD